MFSLLLYYARRAKAFRSRHPKKPRTRRLLLECLEDRCVPSTYTVSNGLDLGPDGGFGSLRLAILSSNAHPAATGTNLIDFNLPLASLGQIVPNSALPAITSPVVINGLPPGGDQTPFLLGEAAGQSNGLTIDANGCTIESMFIEGFKSAGILVSSNNNLITDNTLGSIGGLGANGTGIVITGNDNTIGGTTTTAGNFVTGNSHSGVVIDNGQHNQVEGNLIGFEDESGQGPPGNGLDGVKIEGAAAQYNTIGGTAAGAANTISDNEGDGVGIITDATANTVEGNFIGTNFGGTSAFLGNHQDGIFIGSGANGNFIGNTYNTIEGKELGLGNVISGNGEYGVEIKGVGTEDNLLIHNFIGTNQAGTAALGNRLGGVLIHGEATDNSVGGGALDLGNFISGNDAQGVIISGEGTTGNTVVNNRIGTTEDGTGSLPNHTYGVMIEARATGNTIGTPGEGNLISGNTYHSGVYIADAGTSHNNVEGNLIGTNADDTGALENLVGVTIGLGATDNTIGGTAAGDANVISGNAEEGVVIAGAGTNGNVVEGNDIGTDLTGTMAIPNGFSGVAIDNGASKNTIGGTSQASANIISANKEDGIHIKDATTLDNAIQGNLIGTEEDGVTPLPNSYGVFISAGANNNVIGGLNGGNTIADNTHAGVAITGTGSVGNTISQNSIFGNGTIGIDLGNTGMRSTNTSGGPHTGPNQLQNYPVLTGITVSGSSDVLHGTLNSTPLSAFTIEIFSSPSGGQGETYLGSVPVKTDKFGNASFMFAFAPSAGDSYLTATATDANGNTSEFSAPMLVNS